MFGKKSQEKTKQSKQSNASAGAKAPPRSSRPVLQDHNRAQSESQARPVLNCAPHMQAYNIQWSQFGTTPMHPSTLTTNLGPVRPQNLHRPYTAQALVPANLSQANLHSLNSQIVPVARPSRTALDDMQDRMSMVITSLEEDEEAANHSSPALNRGLLQTTSAALLPSLPGHRNDGPRNILRSAYFSKVWSYSNSRLPPELPPFRVYLPTFPLLCLAARYSLSSYSKSNTTPDASGPCTTTSVQIPSSARLGTKAMTLALAPCMSSSTPTLVVAIRGSATFADWAINYSTLPTSPAGFLDDEGNLVHAGFLHVARSSAAPVAQQLATFLASQVDAGKWRDQGQLLLTGHSAGGATATLLYCHLLSQSATVDSPLKRFRGAFKRIHCLTFGVPPLSLLPLERPRLAHTADPYVQKRWKKNLFFAFINEGDPVVRADKAYVRSLLDLYIAAVPAAGARIGWPIPANTLSNAAKLVVLRPAPGSAPKRRGLLAFGKENIPPNETVQASMTSDEQLRTIVFGDPLMHSMHLYKDRIDKLAVNAVQGG